MLVLFNRPFSCDIHFVETQRCYIIIHKELPSYKFDRNPLKIKQRQMCQGHEEQGCPQTYITGSKYKVAEKLILIK